MEIEKESNLTMKIPKIGELLTNDQIEIIYEAIERRRVNFPGESEMLTLALVLNNIGARYTPIWCEDCGYVGVLNDVGSSLKCPNEHDLMKGLPLRLGWLTPS